MDSGKEKSVDEERCYCLTINNWLNILSAVHRMGSHPLLVPVLWHITFKLTVHSLTTNIYTLKLYIIYDCPQLLNPLFPLQK